jgi:hypothetical protein
MADIFVMVRNQENIALTSIGGIGFVTLLEKDGQVMATESVDLIYADAGFDDLPLGQYTVLVRHPEVEPVNASYLVTLNAENEVTFLRFVYLEPERVLLGVQAAVEQRL